MGSPRVELPENEKTDLRGPIFQTFRNSMKFEYFIIYLSYCYNLLSDIYLRGGGTVYYINKNDFTGRTLFCWI